MFNHAFIDIKSRCKFCVCYHLEQLHTPTDNFSGKAPYIEIETSTFGDQWKAMLDDPTHADITFIVEGEHRYDMYDMTIKLELIYAKDPNFVSWCGRRLLFDFVLFGSNQFILEYIILTE